jgi:hypothetical protein
VQQKDTLLDSIEERLKQTVVEERIFTVEWEAV